MRRVLTPGYAFGLLSLLLVAAVVIGASSAPAVAGDTDPPRAGRAWFGPELDWPHDSPAAYNGRLGADASLFATSVIYPLVDESLDLLRDLSATSAQARSVGVVNVEPSDIAMLTEEDATELAEAVAEVTRQDDSHLLLRFAPEMNGSWKPWGRRPLTYVRSFRSLADAVHGATDAADLVWSPTYGAGYPYTEPINERTDVEDDIAAAPFDRRNIPYLDTDGDGTVTIGDDPYGPYYPGNEYVDWVGLTILRFGLRPALETNTRPKAGELEDRLEEQLGYGEQTPRASFYDRFARPTKQPFLLETGAVYNPARGGRSEADVKTTWLRQVVDAVEDFPLLRGVQWLEQSRVEDEVGGTVRWQIAGDPALASLARAELENGAIALGPVRGIGRDPQAAPEEVSTDAPEPDGGDAAPVVPGEDGIPAFVAGVLVTLAVVAAAGALAWRIRRRRMIPPWLR